MLEVKQALRVPVRHFRLVIFTDPEFIDEFACAVGLAVEPLFGEPRVGIMPPGHRLAAKDTVAAADLRSDDMIKTPDDPPEWDSFTGESRAVSVEARTIEEILEHVAAGRGLVVLPLSAAAYFSRPDLTYVSIADVTPSHVSLAWVRTRRSLLIREYTEIAGEARQLPSGGQTEPPT